MNLRQMRRSIWFAGMFISSMLLYGATYSYSYIPKKIYSSQVFPVTILASGIPSGQSIRFRFESGKGVSPIENIPVKVANGNDFFYTFYFRAQGEDDLIIPRLTVYDGNDTQMIEPRRLHIYKLDTAKADDFCGLIASDFTLLSSQVSMFDNNSILVSIKFKAHEANPDAISIPGSIEEGIENIDRKDAMVNVEYYFVIPSSKKYITISYYNTVEHRFDDINISTDYRNRPVAAQVELNPRESPFDKLKKYGSVALAVFFGLMYLWRRDWLYMVLLLSVSFLIYLVYKPKITLCIKEGAPLYILPTQNSRTSTTVSEELHQSSLGKHEKYYKINYHHGTIGWINEEDLCKN